MSVDELRTLAAAFRRGSSRAEVPAPGPGALGQALSQVERASPEETLLARAALSGLYAQAGQTPAQAGQPAPVYVGGEDDERPTVPPALLALLPQVQAHPALLHEWLALTSAAGMRLTAPQALPLLPLRDDGADRLSAPLWALLDDHARWLARLNPDWKKHDPATPPETLLLARLRRALVERHAIDPEGAVPDLLACWSTLRADERRTVLNAVAASLCSADLPLLELAWQDRLDDVRRQARLLVAHLPGDLADQVRAALKAQLVVDKKGELKYVPGEAPAALHDPKPLQGAPEDSDLALLIAATPLAVIERLFEHTAPNFFQQLHALKVGDEHAISLALNISSFGGFRRTTLGVLGSYSPVVQFLPSARLRNWLSETIDVLLNQNPLEVGPMHDVNALLAHLGGPPSDWMVPSLLSRLTALFAHVLNDVAISQLNDQRFHLMFLSVMLPHLDPHVPLPALPPEPPAPKSAAKTAEEAQKEASRREQSRLRLEQTYADLSHQLDLRRQMHALVQEHRQGAQP